MERGCMILWDGINNKEGFTLLEMVIAMSLFAIGLLGLSLMSAGLVSSNLGARQVAVATHLARSKVETIGKTEYSEVCDTREENLDRLGVEGGGIFERTVTVEESVDPPCKEVAVAVSWRLKGDHRVVIKTIMAP